MKTLEELKEQMDEALRVYGDVSIDYMFDASIENAYACDSAYAVYQTAKSAYEYKLEQESKK